MSSGLSLAIGRGHAITGSPNHVPLPKSAAKVLLIFSAKVQKMHFALREFFTLLDKLYAIFHTSYSMYADY